MIKCPSSSDVDPEDFCRGSGECLEREYVDFPGKVLLGLLLTVLLVAGVPFFMLTEDGKRYLDLYEACDNQPTKEHPLVQEWIKGCTPFSQ